MISSSLSRLSTGLKFLILIFSLTISSCSPPPNPEPTPPPELPTIFGSNESNIDSNCAHALQDETASSQGCLEGFEIFPSYIRVFVRANPPPVYQITILGCSFTESCPLRVIDVENKVTPPQSAPAGTMARFSFLIHQPLNPSIKRICARQDTAIPVPNKDSALLGCLPIFEQIAISGAFQVRVAKEGVQVDGWVLDPTTDQPIQIELHRGNYSVSVTADHPDTRSQERWSHFSTEHGFQTVLPFFGIGGSQSICIAFSHGGTSTTSDELACAEYMEVATIFMDERTYTVGEAIPFTAEMLDPGARLHLNLYTSGNFFLLPWKDADVGTIVADSHGHAEGELPSTMIPPGSYTLAFLCESGCSKIDAIPNYTGVLANHQSYPVALGPTFSIVPDTQAIITVTSSSGMADHLQVEGSNLPPSTGVDVVLVFGAVKYGDGRRVVDSIPTNVASDGRISVSIGVRDLPSSAYLIYVVGDHDQVFASATFNK